MQGISFHFDVLQILALFLYVINLLSGCLELCQYLIILIVPILQFYFELLFLLQSSLKILNISILHLYNLLVLDLHIRRSKQNISHLYIIFCFLFKHSSSSYVLIQFYFYPLHKPQYIKPRSLTLGTCIWWI